MTDRIPKVFNYIRLMQEYTPCVTEWQYQDKDGVWVNASLDECIIQSQENGAEYAKVGVFRQDLKQLVEFHPYDLPDVRNGKIEIDADGMEKERIEKMIKRVVAKVEEPQLSDNIDISHCKTWEDALAELTERNELITEYRDYVETCNSLRLLYNLLTPDVNEYLTKHQLIDGTNVTEYYQEIANCKNLIKKGCDKIIISVENGSIVNVRLFGRNGKDVLDIPLLDKRTDVRCRSNMHEDFLCIMGDEPVPQQNISLQLLNLIIDPKDVWVDVKKMSFHYVPDSDYLYTFKEVLDNVTEYLQSVSRNEIRIRNPYTQLLCSKLWCIYRYLIETVSINIDKRDDAWDFICNLWNFSEDFRVSAFEYIRKFNNNKSPVVFIYKR